MKMACELLGNMVSGFCELHEARLRDLKAALKGVEWVSGEAGERPVLLWKELWAGRACALAVA